MKYVLRLMALLCFASLLAACSPEPSEAPTEATGADQGINDESCSAHNLAKLDASVRQRRASACLRRGTYGKSSGQKW
jgi:entry exclusion lipoprotein TrbK